VTDTVTHLVPRSSRRSPRAAPQAGQALTEFLVIALALLPLFLLIPMIAKYQDIAHMTQMAARYAAFDASIRNDGTAGAWKSETQLADEIRRRFFGNSDAAIKTNDVAGNFDAHRNLFWRGPDDKPLLADFHDVSVSFGPDRLATHDGAFTSASDTAGFPGAAGFGLASKGIYTANVSVKLANLPAGLAFYRPLDAINLAMTRSTSVLLNPWTARDAADIEARILGDSAAFPAGLLAPVASAVDAYVSIVDLPGGISGPKLGKLDFWRDVVPADRLQAAKR
jgi:hypothetical protein